MTTKNRIACILLFLMIFGQLWLLGELREIIKDAEPAVEKIRAEETRLDYLYEEVWEIRNILKAKGEALE